MSETTARDGAGTPAGPPDAQTGAFDWRRIEGSPEFRELRRRRHRFIALLSAVFLGWFLAYLLLATFAGGFMGTRIGGVPVAFLAAASQILMTWAVTWTYLRRADSGFAPLEDRVVRAAEPRFARAAAGAPPTRTPAERTAR